MGCFRLLDVRLLFACFGWAQGKTINNSEIDISLRRLAMKGRETRLRPKVRRLQLTRACGDGAAHHSESGSGDWLSLISASRTPVWPLSESKGPGLRLSRVRRNLDRLCVPLSCRRSRLRRALAPSGRAGIKERQ